MLAMPELTYFIICYLLLEEVINDVVFYMRLYKEGAKTFRIKKFLLHYLIFFFNAVLLFNFFKHFHFSAFSASSYYFIPVSKFCLEIVIICVVTLYVAFFFP